MTTGDYGSADCLRRFKNEAGLADANELDDAADLYPLLADAQEEVIRELAARGDVVKALYQAPTTLTAATDRKTFTFGVDPNNPLENAMPLGWVQISTRLSAFSGDTFIGWREGYDFIAEGNRIRLTSDRSYSGTLYARWVPTPPRLTSAVAPILRPAQARELIVYKAIIAFGRQGAVRPDLVAAAQANWAQKFPIWCLTYRKQYKGGGALNDPSLWYLHGDLGKGQGFTA